jgi:hypothetical protein
VRHQDVLTVGEERGERDIPNFRGVDQRQSRQLLHMPFRRESTERWLGIVGVAAQLTVRIRELVVSAARWPQASWRTQDIGVLLVWADLDGGDCGWKGRKGIPHRRGEWREVGDASYVGAQSEKVLHRVVHPIVPLRRKVARQRDAPRQPFAEAGVAFRVSRREMRPTGRLMTILR